MTRETIDFGIDLGTTNSVVAVGIDGRSQLIRNSHQEEITPSAVMVDRGGAVSVGKRAYGLSESAPDRVACEFKRGMGTDRMYSLSNRTMTPEDLSAEVLKELRAGVQQNFQEDLTAAVITVPAWFTLAACQATTEAARLAGITQAPLLQEPIAAGLAYGYDHENVRGFWLVYDLGGGTFDSALMTIRDGHLIVIDHAGDDYLGGRDLDNLLVDYVVAQLRQSYRIDGPVRGGGSKHRLYAKLKNPCEDAKIRLSRHDKVTIDIADAMDDDGKSIETYVDVSRSIYESLVSDTISKTIQIVRDLFGRQRLAPGAVQRVIMVGGPTYTPYIRDRVRNDLEVELDTRVDPMTIVATGAAVFAASKRRESGGGRAPVIPTPGAIRIDLTYDPVADDVEALVGGRIKDSVRPGLSVQIARDDGGWETGRISLTGGTFTTTILLRERRVNPFSLRLFDASGATLSVEPNQLTISHGLVADDPPLSQSLGIVVEGNWPTGQSSEILIPRGARVPATGKKTFRTTGPVGSGHSTAIELHIIEGESELATHNEWVGSLRLDATNVRRLVPSGSQIDITFSLDASRKLAVRAFVPILDETFHLEILNNRRPTPNIDVLEGALGLERARIDRFGAVGNAADASEFARATEAAIRVAQSGDPDSLIRAQRRLRELQIEVDRIAGASEYPLLIREFETSLKDARNAVDDFGQPIDRQQLAALERDGMSLSTSRESGHLRRIVDQLNSLRWRLVMAQDGWWIGLFQYLVENQSQLTDISTARVLIQEARRALDKHDFENLRKTCIRLWEMMPREADGSEAGFPDVHIQR